MRRLAFALVALALLLGVPTLSGHGQEPKKKEDKVADLMHKKLEASQKVLEGLALNDFEKIGKQSDELLTISKRAEWKVLKTPKYELYSNEFQRTAEDLAKSAKKKNIDEAALNYVELTLTCVKCHKYVRETRDTSADDPAY
jgi:hypothetical protein